MTAQENGPEQSNGNGSLDTVADSLSGDDRELVRFLVGLLLLGGDELSKGLAGAEPAEAEPLPQEGASDDRFRYLTLGLLARGQRRAGRALRIAYRLSTGTASRMVDRLDRWTDNWLMRPFRYPIERRIRSWQQEADEVIEEGKREERDSRALAAERLETLVEYLFDQLAESQELDRLILELVGQKSTSYAARLVDNLRALTSAADYALENALRKLLRRTPRRALPPSPLTGQPQIMYDSENLVRRVMDYVG